LLAFELKQSKHDEALFYTNELYLTVYVNDIKAFVPTNQLIDALSAYLHSKYEMITKDVTFYLGMKINRRSNGIYLSQTKYIRDLLQKHDMKKCVPAPTPMIETKLTKASDDYICNQTHLKDYQILLDELMHLMIQIKSDIAYSISRLAQFMINSTDDH
jgi:hypothetical protein